MLHVAGTENGAAWMHEQVRALRHRGHDATAIISGAGGTLAPRFTADNISFEVAELDVFGGKPLDAARRVITLARAFRRLRRETPATGRDDEASPTNRGRALPEAAP